MRNRKKPTAYMITIMIYTFMIIWLRCLVIRKHEITIANYRTHKAGKQNIHKQEGVVLEEKEITFVLNQVWTFLVWRCSFYPTRLTSKNEVFVNNVSDLSSKESYCTKDIFYVLADSQK